jgi:hypothetical protein
MIHQVVNGRIVEIWRSSFRGNQSFKGNYATNWTSEPLADEDANAKAFGKGYAAGWAHQEKGGQGKGFTMPFFPMHQNGGSANAEEKGKGKSTAEEKGKGKGDGGADDGAEVFFSRSANANSGGANANSQAAEQMPTVPEQMPTADGDEAA